MAAEADNPYVSRGGLKLLHALEAFALDVRGLVCADLGCSTGGFTDCLLQAGALRVHAVDTGYGVLAWKLRQDSRVVVHERANALHFLPAERVDLVVIDAGWTPQKLILPAARRWLEAGGDNPSAPARAGQIVTLIKPHYEDREVAAVHRGILPDREGEAISRRVASEAEAMGFVGAGMVPSPVRGSGKAKEGAANREWLAHLRVDVAAH